MRGRQGLTIFLLTGVLNQIFYDCIFTGLWGLGNLDLTYMSSLFCRKGRPRSCNGVVFIGRTDVEAETPIFWPPDVKSGLIWKDPDAGKDWGQEEKGTAEDEMVGWHHRLSGYGFGWTPGVSDGQGGLARCSSWGHKDRTWLNDWTELNLRRYVSRKWHTAYGQL